MRRELILKEGQKYLDYNDICALLDKVFIGSEESITSKYACHSMPCAMPPCARYKPTETIKKQE